MEKPYNIITNYNTNKNQVMRITDELRAWAKEHLSRSSILAIADRIDAEYQKVLDKYQKVLDERFNALMDARDKGVNAVLKEPEGFGLTALPKDADDMRWNIGDKDEYGNEIVELVLNSNGWYLINGTKCKANSIRHYHALTVEDLIRNAIGQCIGHLPEYWDEPIAECAAKLQLKED